MARTTKMGITLQNDLKLKFDKGVDKGSTRGKSSEIFWNSARGGAAARAARTNRAARVAWTAKMGPPFKMTKS